jgi:hypothetical protein
MLNGSSLSAARVPWPGSIPGAVFLVENLIHATDRVKAAAFMRLFV